MVDKRYDPGMLMVDVNRLIEEYLEHISMMPREAVNVAHLSCRTVRFCIDDRANEWVEVVVEEASPNCPAFIEFINNGLIALGYKDVSCATEW